MVGSKRNEDEIVGEGGQQHHQSVQKCHFKIRSGVALMLEHRCRRAATNQKTDRGQLSKGSGDENRKSSRKQKKGRGGKRFPRKRQRKGTKGIVH